MYSDMKIAQGRYYKVFTWIAQTPNCGMVGVKMTHPRKITEGL
jgi:hypothetical protein